MATTRFIPMHRNKGKTIAACLKARTDYAKNPDKTDGGALVSAYECDPRTVDAEFAFAKREYKAITGREHTRDVIAYQVRQSFKPGEITPEEANRIGYEFAMRFLKGNHAFIVATHIDKKHIHNHIIWNSTTLDCTGKWRDFHQSARAMRRLSDTICIENGLSVVENPKEKGKHYGKWLGENAKPSHREQIRAAIDTAIEKKPADFSTLLDALTSDGYEIKRGKTIALKAEGQKRFIRMDTLGDDYSPENLQAVLDGKRAHAPRAKAIRTTPDKPVRLLVDIQAALSAGKGAGDERWAKVFNLKQMAQTMNYIAEHGLTDYDALKQKTAGVVERCDTLLHQIKEKEKRLSEISTLRTHIIQYIKTRDVYIGYRKNGYSAKYLNAHEADILLHKAAKRVFNERGLSRLPTIAQLNSEFMELTSEKNTLYAEYRSSRASMKELLAAKANIDRILLDTETKTEPDRNRDQLR
jgi:hypothetical protein